MGSLFAPRIKTPKQPDPPTPEEIASDKVKSDAQKRAAFLEGLTQSKRRTGYDQLKSAGVKPAGVGVFIP